MSLQVRPTSEEEDNDLKPVRPPTLLTTDTSLTSTSYLDIPQPRVSLRRSTSPSKTDPTLQPKHADHTRLRLPQYSTLSDAVTLLLQSSNVLILTGAGISTSANIPDFRSPDTGIFSRLQAKGIYKDPEELFHISGFLNDPTEFYETFAELLPATTVTPTPTHAFIRLLQDKGKLLRNYTQNIDQLEREVGIAREKVVNCHGTIAPGVCLTCHHELKSEKFFAAIRRAAKVGAPQCGRCDQKFKERREEMRERARRKRDRKGLGGKSKDVTSKNRKRKRGGDDDAGYGSSDLDDDTESKDPYAALGTAHIGVYRPSITFYGEQVPERIVSCLEEDQPKADLLVVIGTSLKVTPVSNLCADLPADVPQIHISKDACRLAGVTPDVELLGPCDVVMRELVRRAGWGQEFDRLVAKQVGGDGNCNGAVGGYASERKIGASETKVKVELMEGGEDNRWLVSEVKDKKVVNGETKTASGITGNSNGNEVAGCVSFGTSGHDGEDTSREKTKPGKIPLRPTGAVVRQDGDNDDHHKINGRALTDGSKIEPGH